MRFPALAISAVALAAVILIAYADAPDRAFATSPPSAQRMSIDMDPANFPANSATSLGSREACAAMIENNILDADEDLTDTVEFDVTITGIPAANAAIGYVYTLSFPGPSTAIVGQQPMLINPLGIPPEPPFDTDGTFNVSIFDPGGTGVSGSGVLDRLRIQTQPGALSGVFPLTLSNAAHIDTNGIPRAPDALDNAMVEVNASGCGGPADIELVSMSLTSSSPIPVGANSTVTVDMTVRNNGPERGMPYASTSFNVPSGCTLNNQSGTVVLNTSLGPLYAGMSVNHQETPSLRCTAIGPFQMPVTACGLDITTLDLISSNNCQTQDLPFDVFVPPGTDSDSDGVWDLDEFNCGVSTFGNGFFPERLNGADDDGDTAIDEALPPGSESSDCDGDGYRGAPEAHVFGSGQDQDRCGLGNWPADFVAGGVPDSTDRINITDLVTFIIPPRHLNTNVGDNLGDVRWDLVPGKGAVFLTDINIEDLVSMTVSSPPMFSGARAFNGLACTP